jgi:hypothetical protein
MKIDKTKYLEPKEIAEMSGVVIGTVMHWIHKQKAFKQVYKLGTRYYVDRKEAEKVIKEKTSLSKYN